MAMQFRDVLDSMQRDGDDWLVDVPEDWQQGRTVFGGMQVALSLRAMRATMTGDVRIPLRSLQATFIAPLAGSNVRLRAQVLRTGKSATHARCDLFHDRAIACTSVAIFGAPRPSSISLEIPRPVLSADPDSLGNFPVIPGVTPNFVRHIEMRWAQGTLPFTGQIEPRSAIFVRLRDRRCDAEDAVIALADSIPTPALSMLRARAPASSLNWMLELLGDPALLDRDRWSLIGTEVRAGADGYLSQTSILWGASGHAFCVSHQSVGIFG